MFSISNSRAVCDLDGVPYRNDFVCYTLHNCNSYFNKFTLNSMCSTKCATPLLLDVSHLDPASIHKPTVAVCEPLSSVAILIPFSNVVTLVSGTFT